MTSSSGSSQEISKFQQYLGGEYDPSKGQLISPGRAEQMEVDKSDTDDNEPTPELIFSKHELIGLKSCLKSSSGGLQQAVKRVKFNIVEVSSPEVDIQLNSSAQTRVEFPKDPSESPGLSAQAYRLVPTPKFVCVEAELGEDMASFLKSMKPAAPSKSRGANGIKKKRPITRKTAVSQRPLNGISNVSAHNKQAPPPTSSAEPVSSKEFPESKFSVREGNRVAQEVFKESEVQLSRPAAKRKMMNAL